MVVTEYGIICLKGKTRKQRADAFIAIAAPQFQEALRKERKELFG